MTSKPPSPGHFSAEEPLSTGKPLCIGDWLKSVRRSLQVEKPNPESDTGQETQEMILAAQVILSHVVQRPRSWLLAHPEALLDPDQLSHLDILFEQLRLGVPLPYLTGRQEFFGLEFEVTQDVLVPRPETELLVEHALSWLNNHPGCRLAADVGTGSGCIAVSLAARVSYLSCLAVDRSWKALQVARRNTSRHGVASRVHLVNADLLTPFSGPIDLVCANLPYIPRGILKFLPLLKYEPFMALDGGEDGLDQIRTLLIHTQSWLAPGGLILLEMQFDQGEQITHLAKTSLPEAQVAIHADLAGNPRLVEIQNRKEEDNR